MLFVSVFPSSLLPSLTFCSITTVLVPLTFDFIGFIPYLLSASNAKSKANTIAAVIITITTTAAVLFTSCFGVGQITFFNISRIFLEILCLFIFYMLHSFNHHMILSFCFSPIFVL